MTFYVPAKEFEGELWVKAADFQKAISEAEGRSIAEAEQPAQQRCVSNCDTCDHKANPDGGWCYMFHDEPEGVCSKHTPWIAPDHNEQHLEMVEQQEPVAWRNAAIRVGEDLCSVGPFGYYDMTAEQWLDWALSVVTVHAPPPQRTRQGLTDEDRRFT